MNEYKKNWNLDLNRLSEVAIKNLSTTVSQNWKILSRCNEKYYNVSWQNHLRSSKKYWRNSNQTKIKLVQRRRWRSSKHYSNKWECNQKNLQQCKHKKFSYLKRIENLLRNQLTFIKAMKTHENPYKFKSLVLLHWED